MTPDQHIAQAKKTIKAALIVAALAFAALLYVGYSAAQMLSSL